MNTNEKIPWPFGLKKTKQRLEILEALSESEKPMSVQELLSALERRGNPIWLSTVYRVLDTLIEHGMIQKADVHENGMAVYELGDEHQHYAVCVDCRQIIAIHGCPLDGFTPSLQDKNFHVLGHKLQISGYCEDCYDKRQREA